jgi:mono/diheme cytochrome c family protein
MKSIALAALVLLLAALTWPQTESAGQKDGPAKPLIQSVKGPDLYRAYCASCHGLDGKGGGPAARALKVPPPDLTLLAHANRKAFPRARVRQIIVGADNVAAHGSREMPVWGPIFSKIEWDQDLGRVRIDNLVKHLESMQKR